MPDNIKLDPEAPIPSSAIKSRVDALHCQKFIIEVARCFLAFGTPAHKLEAQLNTSSKVLGIRTEFLLLPNVVLLSFYDAEQGARPSDLHVVKRIGGISLSQLRATQTLYKGVMNLTITPQDGWKELIVIQQSHPPYSYPVRCFIGFLCGVVITLLAFEGSFLDAVIAGACQGTLVFLIFHMMDSEPLLARLIELVAAFFISFASRGLYSHTSHKVCYSAVSSGGIVLILPGYAVMSAALELSNKTMLTGSLKLAWGIFQALLIGFIQTLGSDFWLSLDSGARAQRLEMMQDITETIFTKGMLTANWTTGLLTTEPISLSVMQTLDPSIPYSHYNYIGVGCYRAADWPWYLQALDWQWTLLLVPTFACLLALWNLQAVRNWKDVKNLIIMVVFACGSYAANVVGQVYIHGSVGGLLGASVIGLLGTVYGRLCNGFAFAAMIPGVLVLVPTGLIAVGGLAQNYSPTDDQFASGLNTGVAMINLSISITIGLCIVTAGYHVFMLVKELVTKEKEDIDNTIAF